MARRPGGPARLSVEQSGSGWAIPWLPLMLVAVGAIATLVLVRKRALLSRRR